MTRKKKPTTIPPTEGKRIELDPSKLPPQKGSILILSARIKDEDLKLAPLLNEATKSKKVGDAPSAAAER